MQFGPEQAAELMAEGEGMTTDDLVAALAGSPAPTAMLPGVAGTQGSDPLRVWTSQCAEARRWPAEVGLRLGAR